VAVRLQLRPIRLRRWRLEGRAFGSRSSWCQEARFTPRRLTMTLQPSTQYALLVGSDDDVEWDCQIFYLSQVMPDMVSMVFAPLRYIGQN
jgi:hypothetical protein